jgi:hypothetical protein
LYSKGELFICLLRCHIFTYNEFDSLPCIYIINSSIRRLLFSFSVHGGIGILIMILCLSFKKIVLDCCDVQNSHRTFKSNIFLISKIINGGKGRDGY